MAYSAISAEIRGFRSAHWWLYSFHLAKITETDCRIARQQAEFVLRAEEITKCVEPSNFLKSEHPFLSLENNPKPPQACTQLVRSH
jgi:hypothetical protein